MITMSVRIDAAYKQRTVQTHDAVHVPYVKDSKNSVDIVLLGDSHFERLTWFGSLKQKVPKNVFVASVGGDRVENISYRLEGDDGLVAHLQKRVDHPRHLVFMAGGNNKLTNDMTVHRVVATILDMLKYINHHLPQTVIHVFMIPRACSAVMKGAKYDLFCAELSHMCNAQGFNFSREIYDNTLKYDDKRIFVDDVHLNEFGYQQCVLPVLNKILSLN